MQKLKLDQNEWSNLKKILKNEQKVINVKLMEAKSVIDNAWWYFAHLNQICTALFHCRKVLP